MVTRSRPRLAKPGLAAPADAEFHSGLQTVGWLHSVDAQGQAWVDFAGNCAGPLAARSVVQCSASALAAAGPQPAVLLGFEGLDTSRPIVLGLLHTALVVQQPVAVSARVDGRRVELTGQQEVVLRCGLASITLHANGRIQIQGSELQSRASGRNRILGSTVAIN